MVNTAGEFEFSLGKAQGDPALFVQEAFRPGNLLSKFMPGYEERPEQSRMALAVLGTIASQGELVVEAGTGVGKSLAYLFPAILWSSLYRDRIVISTHTVNLQQQLISKDLPLLSRVFSSIGAEFRYNLLKGRAHYLCRRMLDRELDQVARMASLLQPDKRDEIIRQIDEVTEGPWDGDRDTLGFAVPDEVWTLVASDSDRCMGAKCPKRPACYYQQHRKKLESSHIIVVNHALFASHLKLSSDTGGKTALLPGFKAVVFDEAHHLEDVARQSLGSEITRARLKRLCDDILRCAGYKPISSMLGRDGVSSLKKRLEDLEGMLDYVLAGLDPLKTQDERNTRSQDKLRITSPGSVGSKIILALRGMTPEILDWEDLDLSDEERFEVGCAARRLETLASDLERIDTLEGEGTEYVYWSEASTGRRGRTIALKSSPLDVSAYMSEKVFSGEHAVILTSATLSAGGNFGYIQRTLGLKAPTTLTLSSPFNYREQARLIVPSVNSCLDVNSKEFDDYVASIIPEIVDEAAGRTFVLFTSRRQLDYVWERVKDKLESKGYPVFAQGNMPRERLVEEFKKTGRAVLFGLDSFWEGVDIPGEALSCVVIARIPFPVPDDPVIQAREQKIKASGGNPFQEYWLPHAAFKLKQGFGRLIRTREDRGAVVILDHRIITKKYGKMLVSSLPPAPLSDDISDIRRIVPPSK